MASYTSQPPKRQARITFLNCENARLFSATVSLDGAEEASLRALLANLESYGVLLLPDAEPAGAGCDLGGVVGMLRGAFGEHVVNAALVPGPAAQAELPVAIMPVWAFLPEGEGEDVLLSSGRLWGTDLLIEALRVEDDDDPAPVVSVRERHEAWTKATPGNRHPRAARMPGRAGSYAIFAAAAPV